jgi:hypothetical protein
MAGRQRQAPQGRTAEEATVTMEARMTVSCPKCKGDISDTYEGMVALPKDSPIMRAWDAYKATPDYANSLKWAAHDEHRVGSMWAAFLQGWTLATERAASLHESVNPASDEGEMTEARGFWKDEVLWWRIGGDEISDKDLRTWIWHNLEGVGRYVDVVRKYQIDAYANRNK